MTNGIIFSDMERDVIGEVMNISLGSSATSLSALLGKRVEITVPNVKVITSGDFSFDAFEPAIGAEIRYTEGLDGINVLILKKADAKSIIEILMGQTIPPEEFVMDEISTSAICEVMNQMMGSAATALADFIGRPINISTPIAYEIESREEFKDKYFSDNDIVVAVSFNLFIEDIVQSEFLNVMSLDLAREMVSIFLKGTDEGEEASSDNMPDEGVSEDTAPDEEDVYDEEEDMPEEEIIEEEKPVKKKPAAKPKPQIKGSSLKKKPQEPVSVRPMEYESFDDEEDLSDGQLSNLELIMSVPLEVSVEIGKAKKQIKEILEFSQGTIIELDKQAGALVDIVVNGQLIARGEVVVLNDNFGVRVMEILKKDELIKLTV